MLDLDALLAPISDDAPSGPDMEYESDFSALEMAAKPVEERAIGDTVIPGEDPDYNEVSRLAQDLLTRTQDLRVAATLANAVLHTEGFAAFREVLQYARGCLETHWETVHPQLDEDDGDPTMRVNAVLTLASSEPTLRSLRHAPLIHSRAFGRFSLRDMEVAAGEIAPLDKDGTPPDTATISAAMQDMDPAELAALVENATQALEAVKEISAAFDAHIGSEGPDLAPLQKALFDIRRRVTAMAPDAAGAAPEVEPDSADGPADTPRVQQGSAGGSAPDVIRTPEDVKAALDRVMTYYRTYEPSSPLPILLERAKRLVAADFLTIVKDMAPDGFGNVVLIGGIEPDDGEEGTYG